MYQGKAKGGWRKARIRICARSAEKVRRKDQQDVGTSHELGPSILRQKFHSSHVT
jgi:hypothetical protein